MSNEESLSLVLPTHFPFAVHAPRMDSNTPSSYRLRKKATGEIVLIGAFAWSEGLSGGIEWREIETEIEPCVETPRHDQHCDSLTTMLPSMPPKPAPCNCSAGQPEVKS